MRLIRRFLKRFLRRGTYLHDRCEDFQRFLWKRTPRLFDYRQNMSSIGIYLTSRCSLACANCDRAVTVAPGRAPISVDQVRRFVDESLRLGWRWKKIMLIGGEPTLHPKFREILDAIVPYREVHPECDVQVLTSGYGPRVRRDIAELAGAVTIRNSEKSSSVQTFQKYTDAPVDDDRFRDADFTRGCYVIEYCGLELTSHGYYTCGAGGAVDRVFGFDIGLPSLEALTEPALREQRARLCRYCGHFKYNEKEAWSSQEVISPAWREALAKYRSDPPKLTEYAPSSGGGESPVPPRSGRGLRRPSGIVIHSPPGEEGG